MGREYKSGCRVYCTGADLLELKVKKPYPVDYDACVSQVGRDGKNYEPELSVQIPDLAASWC